MANDKILIALFRDFSLSYFTDFKMVPRYIGSPSLKREHGTMIARYVKRHHPDIFKREEDKAVLWCSKNPLKIEYRQYFLKPVKLSTAP